MDVNAFILVNKNYSVEKYAKVVMSCAIAPLALIPEVTAQFGKKGALIQSCGTTVFSRGIRKGKGMRSFRSEILAVANSRKIAAFVTGSRLSLPNGENIFVRVKNTFRVQRSPGFRFSKYSYVTEVQAGEQIGFGYGEAESQLIAFQKSIVEGVERAIYLTAKTHSFGTSTSNGWSAHINAKLAYKAALEELHERDAVLVHWLCHKPFCEIDPATFSAWLTNWIKEELSLHPIFNRLRILLTTAGNIPVIMTLLQSHDGRALISQSSGSTLEAAIYKALAETCRIGEIANIGRFQKSSKKLMNDEIEEFSPEDHAMVYAYHLPVPAWVFGPTKTWQEAAKQWKSEYQIFHSRSSKTNFKTIVDGPIVVGYCESENVQNLFFGRTIDAKSKGLLNLSRLESVRQSGALCLLPHCVP